MLSVEEALELVAQHCAPLPPRQVQLDKSLGLKLVDDITSDINSPPHDKAMMDGYAIRSADREPTRRVIEEIAAGAFPKLPLEPGTASRIMTGAPLPTGADSVVPVEQSEMVDESTVRLQQVDPAPGQNVLPLGASMRIGDVVLRNGAMIRPIEIAILAETGRASAFVTPRPRVAILPTGDELVNAGEKPGPGQIRNSNGPMLRAAAFRADADALELSVARDNHEDLTNQIQCGLAADILVLSGGVSAGKFDLVPQVLAEQGVETVFHKIALRPGKPLWFGIKKTATVMGMGVELGLNSDPNSPAPRVPHPVSSSTTLVFGLPGNPVSSLVCFELFVRPAIAALSGRGFVQLSSVNARLTAPYDHAGLRAACLPALIKREGSEFSVSVLPWQGSADVATLASANGLVRFPAEKRLFASGDILDVLPL